VDETGQHGGATPGENGNGAGPHGDNGGPARRGGWAAADSAWSNAGSALEPSGEPVRPSWRTSGQQPGGDSAASRGWADASPRYADLLSPLSPAAPLRPVANGATYEDRPTGEHTPIALRVPASAPPYPYEGDLEDRTPPPIPAERPAPTVERDSAPALPPVAEAARHAIEESTPSGGLPQASRRERPQAEPPAPRWPERPELPQPPPGGPAAPAMPTAPAMPGYASLESPPAYEPPPGFRPQPERPLRPYDTSMYERPPSPGPSRSNTPWDWRPERSQESTEARRAAPPEPTLEPPPPPPAVLQAPAPPAVPAATQAPPRRTPEPVPDALPQRVPAEPDVPTVPEPPTVEPSADAPDLTRIWSHLRRDDVQPRERPEGFDVQAIVAAVRGVEGVRDASVRQTPSGAHNLRLDLADGADPAEVSRMVARLLQERMGLAAAPREVPAAAAQQQPQQPQPSSGSSYVPAQPQPTGRASVPSPGEPRRRAARRAYQEDEEELAPPPRVVAAPPAAVPPPGVAPDEPEEPAYPLGQSAPVEAAPPRPLKPLPNPGPRVTIDEVQVSTFGLDATVEVRLAADERRATGRANGPAVDAYVLRLCATAAAAAIDDLLSTAEQPTDRGRCFVEHTAVVPFGTCEVAIVVVLLVCGGWVEQLAGSALVAGDPRQAVVRATLGAVNRRLESLLS
jgi:hypothetical protein